MGESTSAGLEWRLSGRARRAGPPRLADPRAAEGRISLFAGFPDPASFPVDDLLEGARLALARDAAWALQYGSPLGYPPLVAALRDKLARDQGIAVPPEGLLVTNGAGQALQLIVDALCDPGDVVLSEEPTWSGALRAFQVAGVEVVPVPIDAEGLDVDALARALDGLARAGRRPKLLYTIPTFQNPTGVTTTLPRRQRIVDLAARHDLLVVEDDAYVDLRYEGEPLPALGALDRAGVVLTLGTFSKILAAGVRLGWVAGPPDLIAVLAGLKAEGGTSPFAGALAAELLASGTLDEHVGALRRIYRARRDAMLAALAEAMPPGAHWSRPDGGFFVWLTLPPGVDADRVTALARERGVDVLPGTACRYQGGADALRLSFSFADEARIGDGVRVLAEVVREAARRGQAGR